MIESDRAFLGHPRGLAYLLFTEAWERFSYYGMQSLLALYLVKHLLQPGQSDGVLFFAAFRRLYGGLDGQPLASAIVGTYFASVYVTPILGGLLADRLLGRHRTVLLGALTMMAGHFLMAIQATFLFALLLLVLGSGMFKGNLASQVGALYAPHDQRRAGAFQLYYLGINLGLIAAPLVIGTLAERWSWHYGFAAAGIGMLVATLIYWAGRTYLPADSRDQRGRADRGAPMRQDRRRLILLILLVPVFAVAIVPNNQIFNAYLLWGDRHFAFGIAGMRMPTSWLVALDAGLGLALLAGLPFFYRWYGRYRHEPDEVAKIAIGSIFSTGGMLCLALAASLAGPDGRVSLLWALSFHLLNGIGFAHILPVSLAMFTRLAPASLAGRGMGLYYLIFFFGNIIAGWVGGFYAVLTGPQFWLLHAAMAAGTGAIFLCRSIFRDSPT